MKKGLFLLATAALVLAGCNNDVTLDENVALAGSNAQKEIKFAPIAKKPMRVGPADTYQYAIDGTTFPTDLNMFVAAYQVEPTAANYFAGTKFTYSGATTIRNGTTKRYWPLSAAYINFLAYANVTGSAAFDATNYASAAVITQTDNSSAQTDLMYAKGSGEVTKSGNTLTFPTNVGMEFIHAQAWMDFYVKAYSDVETVITVNSITLKGAKYAGTYTITHTNFDKTTGQSVAGAWSSLGDAANVAVPGWSATALTTSLVQVGKGLLVVPDDNASTNDWTSFVVNYTYDGKTYDYEYEAPAAPGATVAQKTHYVFNITFKLHEILVDASISDWTDASPVSETVED